MKGKIKSEIVNQDVWTACASAFAGLEKYYLDPSKLEEIQPPEDFHIEPPPDSIEIEVENEYGWKNKVYIPKNIIKPC